MALAEKAVLDETMSVFDLCCCNGAGLSLLVGFRNVASLLGVDATETVVDRGGARCREEGLDDRIRLRLGDAGATLQDLVDAGRAGTFDFIFIDADKQNYPLYYELSLKLLRSGGLMAVDNTLWSGAVADPGNDEPGTRAIRRFNAMLNQDDRVDISLVPIGDGLTLVRKAAT